jgi:porin
MGSFLRRPLGRLRALTIVVAAAVVQSPAVAQTVDEEGGRIPGLPEPSIASSLPKELGSLWGLRSHLARDGITFNVNYIGDVLGNPTGGYAQGTFYMGRLEVAVSVDFAKAIGWPGLSLFTNGYYIHGESITAEDLGALMPVSFIEALPDMRLFELWLEQKLFGDKLAIRFGQLAADSEFILNEGGSALLNATWGWHSIAGLNLPDGGPAYPMAAPGVRVAITPDDRIKFMAALFTGDPADDCPEPPQVCNPNGLEFPLSDPLLFLEGAYKYNQEEGELAGTVKLGAWRLFSEFQPESIGNNALPVALPAVPGQLAEHDWALYALFDQMLLRLPGGGDPKGISIFGLVIGAPADGNMSDFYWQAGVTFTGLSETRREDILAIGLAYTGVSPQIAAFQEAQGDAIIADYELMAELSYIAEIVPGFYIQPDFQYFWNPGGHVPLDETGTTAVPNAAVLGLRTTINY